MTVAIMQPYFFPYIGYFQLLTTVDVFVVYDNVQYTKRGWINRNRYLRDGSDAYFTLPLKRDADHLDVRQRCLAGSFGVEREKLKRRIQAAYRGAPNFEAAYELFADCLDFMNSNLFEFLLNSIVRIADYLEIDTRLVVASEIEPAVPLKGKERVITICKCLGATTYINPIGGLTLYDKDEFSDEGIRLSFLETQDVVYPQFAHEFVPNLSILDVIMFNDVNEVHGLLRRFQLR